MSEITTKMIFLVKILLLCQILQQTIALGSNHTEETDLPFKNETVKNISTEDLNNEENSTHRAVTQKNKLESPSNETKLPEEFFQSYFNGWLIKQYNWWKTDEKWSEKFPKDVESFFRYLKWMEEPTAEILMEKMKKETNETIAGLVEDLGENKTLSLFGYYLTLPYEVARLKAVENNGTFYEDEEAPSLNQLLDMMLSLRYSNRNSQEFSFEMLLRISALDYYLKKIENNKEPKDGI